VRIEVVTMGLDRVCVERDEDLVKVDASTIFFARPEPFPSVSADDFVVALNAACAHGGAMFSQFEVSRRSLPVRRMRALPLLSALAPDASIAAGRLEQLSAAADKDLIRLAERVGPHASLLLPEAVVRGRITRIERSRSRPVDDLATTVLSRAVGTPLKEERICAPDTLVIARDVSRALQHLHEAGVVHGAVHPGNVFVERDAATGAVTGASLGGAGMTQWRAALQQVAPALATAWDTALGASAIPAPETVAAAPADVLLSHSQLRISVHDVRDSTRADVWQFGVLLLHLLDMTCRTNFLETLRLRCVAGAPLTTSEAIRESLDAAARPGARASKLFAAANAALQADPSHRDLLIS
jgi:hypothetical protein